MTHGIQIETGCVPADVRKPFAHVDCAQFVSMVGEDSATLLELIDLFLAMRSRQIARLDNATASGDIGQIGREVHSFKGSLAIFGARQALDFIESLEEICVEGSSEKGLREIIALVEKLRAEIECVADELLGFGESLRENGSGLNG